MWNAQFFVRLATCLTLGAGTAQAEPISLKAAYFSSDRTMHYRAVLGPIVDAVNAKSNGLRIVVYASGILGRKLADQPQVVRYGIADIAFIVPGYTSELFPDNAVLELPGLFRDSREATLVYTRLVAKGMLRGYDDFVVLGAYVTPFETFHSRVPLRSIDDLGGKRIRINNDMEGLALEQIGAWPVPLEINEITPAFSRNSIDAALIPFTPLSDYGVKRLATHHFLLRMSGAPLAVVMNRTRFEALPEQEKALLRRYAGEWAAERFVDVYGQSEESVMQQLKSEPQRQLVEPSPADLVRAREIYVTVQKRWAARNPRNAELLEAVNAQLNILRKEE
jgi:TRAP-type C4-dicarboxylate transport system substrate-binding protein